VISRNHSTSVGFAGTTQGTYPGRRMRIGGTMRRTTFSIAVIAATLALLVGGCAPGAGSAPTDGAGLVAQRCTACHTRARVDDARHDRAGWTATVERMRSRGARLTDAEAALVIDFLVKRQVP
jgi:hypothetical protein